MNTLLAIGFLAAPARITPMARIHQGLDTDPVSKFEVPHIGSNLDNYASTLVTRGSHTKMRHGGKTNISLHKMNI
jgi:hypothetical protein